MELNTGIPLENGFQGGGNGGGGGGLGDDPMQMVTQVMKMRDLSDQMQDRELTMRQKTKTLDDDETVNHVLQQLTTETGQPPDLDKAIYTLHTMGRSDAALNLQNRAIEQRKNSAAALKEASEAQQAKLKLATSMAQGITDDESLGRIAPQIDRLIPGAGQALGSTYDKDRVDGLINQGMTASEFATKQHNSIDDGIKALEATQKALNDNRTWDAKQPDIVKAWTDWGSHQFGLATNQGDWDTSMNLLKQAIEPLPSATQQTIIGTFGTQFSRAAIENARRTGMTQAQASEEKSRNANLALEKDKFADSQAADVSLSPDAIEMLATSFAKGAPLPPFGMGQHAANDRKLVFNRAADIYQNLDYADQVAAYRSNMTALNQMVPTLARLKAYQGTAEKNLAPLLAQSKKIIDTGSPWLNQPLRAVNRNVLGNADQAVYDAANRIVTTEFARIISNPNLSGVMSDDARHEVDDIMKGTGATAEQIMRTAQLLVTDSNNRISSQQDEINALHTLVRTPPTPKVQTGASFAAAPVPGGGATRPLTAPTLDGGGAGSLKPNMKAVPVVQSGITYLVTTDGTGKVISAVKQ